MKMVSTASAALLLIGAASGAAAQARPPASALTGDVRCMLAMGAIATNPSSRQAATLGVYYFEGRISARAPGLDLPAAMKAEVVKLNQVEMQNEAKRCSALVNQAAQTLQTVQAAFSKPVTVPAAPATPPPK
jgi:hypothetical protein